MAVIFDQPASCTATSSQILPFWAHETASLPVQREVFLPVPEKPPGVQNLGGVPPIFLRPTKIAKLVNLPIFANKGVPDNMVPLRPLLAIVYAQRPQIHHSIFLQIDGLLHSCFRLRLERDVCVLPSDIAFCSALGPGVSPASTFCGLFWPTPFLLSAVLSAVKQERGYGVFVGPASSEAWKSLDVAVNNRKTSLMHFVFAGPESAPWCANFVSFAYQGKIKRKKPDFEFALEPIFSSQVPLTIAILPFCPARVSALHHVPVASDDTAKRHTPLPVTSEIPLPIQSSVWNVKAMELLAPLFPHQDVASLFVQVIQPTGARLMFAGDNSKRVISANAEFEPQMLAQIRERFVSESAKGRMMGPFNRCPFPNTWNSNQARSTPLDTRKKDKYYPLSERFRVVSNFSAGR